MAPERLLDVSELEAPEPLILALAALETLAPGSYLHLRHRMKPCHLYGYLEQQGFASDTREGDDGGCEVFIWRQDEVGIGEAAKTVADGLKPWRE